ncbi:type I restriction enzyme S subunit [Acidovorax sp. 93]|uniref:restriction endonuclease subunit S n=1 Tax=Acidovorax sp. 93 TaxID=2135632 RepID=UPI000EB60D98|nr:restriction endonuclease subunit S [Acidovorax sp. 93]RKR26735.1 type I restriction enzyme S subunit [Acidovorax sp. 93]
MSFPRYPEYKDSGVEWLGEVPAHWFVGKVKHITSFFTGWTPPTGNAAFYEGENPWANISDLGPKWLAEPSKRISDEAVGHSGIRLSPTGSLLFSFKLSIGQVSFAARDMYTNEAIATFPPSERLNLAFAYYALPLYVVQNASENIYGAKLLNQELIKAASVAVPSIHEQQAIAIFLDRETAKIDALVAEQEKLITLLQEKRQAVISHAVTKGLDLNVPMKDSGVEWLGEVPGHWEVSQLRYVVREGTSITYGIVQAGPEVEDGVPYIRTSDMSGNALPLTGYPKTSLEIDASYARSKVNAGDLVISIRASVGKCLPVPPELDGANLTQGTAKIAPGGKAPAAFMLPFISSEPIQLYLDSKAKGATFKEITLETLRKTPFLVPPLEEQLRIAKWVSDQDQQFQALIDAAEQAQKLLRERRTALISAAVTGQIDARGIASREVA